MMANKKGDQPLQDVSASGRGHLVDAIAKLKMLAPDTQIADHIATIKENGERILFGVMVVENTDGEIGICLTSTPNVWETMGVLERVKHHMLHQWFEVNND